MKRAAISVRPETKKSLEKAASLVPGRDLDAFLFELLASYRLTKLREASRIMRRRVREKGVSLDDLRI